MAIVLTSEPLEPAALHWFASGLAGAFVITILVVVLFCATSFRRDGIDMGFLGLILLLTTIFYLVAFSFLVAASARGLDVKIMVGAIDVFILIGSKLLAPDFLRYLNDEFVGPPYRKRNIELTDDADPSDPA